MARLFDQIKRAVREDRYMVGEHAVERLTERYLLEWQIVESLETGMLRRERQKARPNPVVEVEQILPDGTRVLAVWSWVAYHQAAKLVTVYYLDQ